MKKPFNNTGQSKEQSIRFNESRCYYLLLIFYKIKPQNSPAWLESGNYVGVLLPM